MAETDEQRQLLVVGAGSIGGVSAALIAKAGEDVEIVTKYPDLAERVRTKGLHIFGARGEHTVTMSAVATPEAVDERKDLVFLAMKAPDVPDAAEHILPLLKDDSAVVSLQNGICEETIADIVGSERVIGCTVGWGGTMHNPGDLEMTSDGEFVIGTLDPAADRHLDTAKRVMSAVVPVVVTDNILGALYSKLIINACITTLGAICGLYLGEMLKFKKVRAIFIEIIREAIAVANAMEVDVKPYADKLDYYKFIRKNGKFADWKRHLTIKIIGSKYKKLRSSSLQSLERGKKTEIDHLNGYIVRKGEAHDVPTPLNRKLVALVKEIEAFERDITPENFDGSFFDRFA